MNLAGPAIAIRDRMLVKFPLPLTMEPTGAKDGIFREWCIKLAQQLKFNFPTAGYGVKRADSTRPISKDTIAQKNDSFFVVYDLFSGVGTDNTEVVDVPSSEDVTGQVFEEVDAHNYLDSVVEPPSTGTLESRVRAIEEWIRSFGD